MIARSIAASAMLMAIVGAAGGAYLQDTSALDTAAIRTADVSDAAPATPTPVPSQNPVSAEPEAVADAEPAPEGTDAGEEAERSASAAQRVVESAGFPVVPSEPDADAEAAVADPGPVVTVNGRPLGAPAPESASDDTAVAEANAEVEAEDPAAETTEVASLPNAPVPVPRPDGLEAPGRSVETRYTASTTRADSSVGFERRSSPTPGRDPGLVPQALDRVGARSEPAAPASRAPSPEDEGLIEVIGENGESIWLYPEQVRSGDRAPANAVDTDSYGIVYVD